MTLEGSLGLFDTYFKIVSATDKSLQDKAKRNAPNSTEVGPIGENVLTFDQEGFIVASRLPDFRAGNTIWDYIPVEYHKDILDIIDRLPREKKQPLSFEFKTLYHGRYRPRKAEIYYAFDYGYVAQVRDLPGESVVVDFADIPGNENFITIAQNGLILGCSHPEQTITGDPVGSNIIEIAQPQYRKPLRKAISIALIKKIEVPVEYSVEVNGVVWHQIGTAAPVGATVVFKVKRIAHPS